VNTMKPMLGLLAIATACAFAGCSDNGDHADKISITLFKAAPDAIEVGQSTQLVFAVEPADAEVTIDGLGDLTGQTQVAVTPAATTAYHLTASKGSASTDKTVTVTVGPQTAAALKIEPASPTATAGAAVQVTVTVLAINGKTAPGFRGTVHLSSSDAMAKLPADLVFAAADAGVKVASVTLQTAGPGTLTGVVTTSAVAQGTASLTVAPAAAASCVASQAPAATTAGSVFGVTVALHDPFGNLATTYAGTMQLTASDPRALLPPAITYAPGDDRGSHAFSAALLTAGPQTVTATDTANASLQCSAAVAVAPTAVKLVLSVPGNANAGYPVTVGVTVKDLFDNPIPTYAATVSFTSMDAGPGAAAPAPIVFTGAEGGTATTSATFVTPGLQTLTATDNGTPSATASAGISVQGLLYTAPTTGRVRLVANPAHSNAQVIQLDLVANERLEVSSFFGGGPGPFAAGMNMPLDTGRVGPDAALFTPGNALPLGSGTPAAIGRLASDNILYTGISRKRTTAPIFTQETEVAAGQVFYSVRLRLQPTATRGPVFDGAQPSPLFRAAVRDQYGDDFVNQGDFGLGKLEVR